MKKTLFALSLTLSSLALASTWDFDAAHTSANFVVKHLMISNVNGKLGTVSGAVELDEKDLTKSTVAVSVDVAGLETQNQKRNDHLRSKDFFDVEKFPTITFKSTKVEAGKDGALTVTGDLTMHGVTKPVTLEGALTKAITDPWGNSRRGASFSGKLDRKAWGISWGKVTDVGAVVGDEVKLDIQAEIVKEQPKK